MLYKKIPFYRTICMEGASLQEPHKKARSVPAHRRATRPRYEDAFVATRILVVRLVCREKWDSYLGRPLPLRHYIMHWWLSDVSSSPRCRWQSSWHMWRKCERNNRPALSVRLVMCSRVQRPRQRSFGRAMPSIDCRYLAHPFVGVDNTIYKYEL